MAFAPRFWPGSRVRPVEANGRPAVLVQVGEDAVALLSVDVSPEGIDRIMWVMSPAKLSAYADSPPR
ncbi:hypothetical protein ACFQ8O_23310 [Streptomyces coelicoflavus]|uniref:hypothetical protein n=1 Tax=Streptomyces coelicoflavus TaxID=285562 RepID=UPI0036A68A96